MGQDLQLFEAIYKKMDWQSQRQKVISQNIANADTPNYIPKDLKPLDFKHLLENTTSDLPMARPAGLSGAGRLATTDGGHLGVGGVTGQNQRNVNAKNQKNVYETAPAGNAVILEEQLLKANELSTDHRLITNVYEKNLNLLRTALRGSGQ